MDGPYWSMRMQKNLGVHWCDMYVPPLSHEQPTRTIHSIPMQFSSTGTRKYIKIPMCIYTPTQMSMDSKKAIDNVTGWRKVPQDIEDVFISLNRFWKRSDVKSRLLSSSFSLVDSILKKLPSGWSMCMFLGQPQHTTRTIRFVACNPLFCVDAENPVKK